jgi:nucleotide-binding universal stress UspA family protein
MDGAGGITGRSAEIVSGNGPALKSENDQSHWMLPEIKVTCIENKIPCLMKHILLPTDFSDAAHNAGMYAFALAAKLNAKVTVLHTWHISVGAGDFVGLAEAQIETESKRRLTEFCDTLATALSSAGLPIPEFEAKQEEGFAGDRILEVAHASGVDIIVMGTHGAGGVKEFLLGSITSSLVKSAAFPVLAIPVGVAFHTVKKIGVAVNWDDDIAASVSWVIAFATALNTELELVHIAGENESTRLIDKATILRAFPALDKFKNLNLYIARASSVIAGLDEYLKDSKPDILLMTTHARGFFRRFFDPSLTEKMVNHSHTPLLALHA